MGVTVSWEYGVSCRVVCRVPSTAPGATRTVRAAEHSSGRHLAGGRCSGHAGVYTRVHLPHLAAREMGEVWGDTGRSSASSTSRRPATASASPEARLQVPSAELRCTSGTGSRGTLGRGAPEGGEMAPRSNLGRSRAIWGDLGRCSPEWGEVRRRGRQRRAHANSHLCRPRLERLLERASAQPDAVHPRKLLPLDVLADESRDLRRHVRRRLARRSGRCEWEGISLGSSALLVAPGRCRCNGRRSRAAGRRRRASSRPPFAAPAR